MISGLLLVSLLITNDPPSLSPADRERLEVEARSQSAEADRLFKARSFAEALQLYEAERASRKLLGDPRYEAYAVRAMGCCLSELGTEDDAVAAWQDAVKLDGGRSDKGYEGYDHLLIAQSLIRRDRLTEGVKALCKAIPLLSTAVDRDHEADAQLFLGAALIKLGRPDEATPHLARSEARQRLG